MNKISKPSQMKTLVKYASGLVTVRDRNRRRSYSAEELTRQGYGEYTVQADAARTVHIPWTLWKILFPQ